jgi:hypothetical protein
MALVWATAATDAGVGALAARSGDGVVLLTWDGFEREGIRGWRVSRAVPPGAAFRPLHTNLLDRVGFADTTISNRSSAIYRVEAIGDSGAPTGVAEVAARPPHAFVTDEALLDLLQASAFDYFWREVNPRNGLIRDRNTTNAPCSIAAVGFGLSAITIGIDRGWISRAEGGERVRTTLRTFSEGAQGESPEGTMGHRGWYYHFIDMRTGHRFWKCELSTIDTALLLAGAVDARHYFVGSDPLESEVRDLANRLVERVDWRWMLGDRDTLPMGWNPGDGFLKSRWVGYNEAMLLYLLGMGAARDPLPSSCWAGWTAGYQWQRAHGFDFVRFEPLFGHQYSHAWIDFREISDDWMRGRGLDYFENSRRATLAQQAYAVANPGGFKGYGATVWGFTACDGPRGYGARGAPPAFNDDGTIAPTAVGGALPFAPEASVAALRTFHERFGSRLWTAYGFRDAFNLHQDWWGPDVLGIDQGVVLLMIENYRTGRGWRRFMQAPEVQRGLAAAGFKRFP